jgi:hypothetical protein
MSGAYGTRLVDGTQPRVITFEGFRRLLDYWRNGLRKDFEMGNLVAMKMLAVEEEQFLTDARGKRTGVLLNLAAYERLRQAEEELAELQAYDSRKARAHSEIAAGQSATLASYRRDRRRKVK